MKTNLIVSVENRSFLIGSFNINESTIVPDAVLSIEFSKNKNNMKKVYIIDGVIDGVIDDNSEAYILCKGEWFIISSNDYKTLSGCEADTVVEMIKFLKRQIEKMA